jgi:hypothetical protein
VPGDLEFERLWLPLKGISIKKITLAKEFQIFQEKLQLPQPLHFQPQLELQVEPELEQEPKLGGRSEQDNKDANLNLHNNSLTGN